MRTSRVVASLALAFVLTFLCVLEGAAQVEPGQSFTARVVDVADGGTYDVRRSIGGTVTVRLQGVDAPESSQPYGAGAP